jgi:tight adherence protein C
MDTSTAIVISASVALSMVMFLTALLMWLHDRRLRAARVMAASGKRAARAGTALAGGRGGQKQMNEGLLNFMKRSTRKVSILKGRQVNEIKLALVSAGYKSRDAIVVYTFFKLVAPLGFMIGAAIYVYTLDPIGKGMALDVAAVMAAALLGSKLPDIILKNKRQKRMQAIQKAFPDSLDMLVICAEAGLASDAALKRVVAETGKSASVLSEELELTAMELGFMPERRAALEHFAERVPLAAVKAFASTMIQAEKYGTPLARAFKVLSQEQRNERMMRAEEKASRLPAIMTVPMMVFILPALFIVLIGPAVLDIMDNFLGMQ